MNKVILAMIVGFAISQYGLCANPGNTGRSLSQGFEKARITVQYGDKITEVNVERKASGGGLIRFSSNAAKPIQRDITQRDLDSIAGTIAKIPVKIEAAGRCSRNWIRIETKRKQQNTETSACLGEDTELGRELVNFANLMVAGF